MTKDEAIYLLRNTAWLAPSGNYESVEEAVDMATEALERTANTSPTHECVKPTHECISREDAMMKARPEYLNPNQKGHEEYNKAWNDGVEAYWNGLKELPSEPVGNTEQLDRICAKCKHYTKEQLCVWWSYFGFGPEDYCSRWEEKE